MMILKHGKNQILPNYQTLASKTVTGNQTLPKNQPIVHEEVATTNSQAQKQDLWQMTCFLGNKIVNVREISPATPKPNQRVLLHNRRERIMPSSLSHHAGRQVVEGRLPGRRQLEFLSKNKIWWKNKRELVEACLYYFLFERNTLGEAPIVFFK
jgi:hypothetical protein